MNVNTLQMKKALRAALLVLLLIAVAKTDALAQTQGALTGVFTINDSGDKVHFSQGNLQYQASTSTWRFATHQYDYVGTDNENISATYGGWIDLFGWGTSGYHNPYDNFNTQYQPYSTSTATVNTSCNYYGYGPSTNMQDSDLTGTSAEYDWGVHNAISNGGNQAGLWRTLTKDEWNYIFKTRTASTVGSTTNARFVMATVNGVGGIIIFPDSYSHPSYLPTPLQINVSGSYSVNSFSSDGWTVMENLGCAFLPASGCRYGTSTRIGGAVSSSYAQTPGTFGLYWSTSQYNHGNNSFPYCMYSFLVGFNSSGLYYCDNYRIDRFFGNSTSGTYSTYGRFGGYSVRLVCEVGPTTYNIGTSVNPAESGMVSGGGEYDEGTTCTLTATPNPGYSFINWTENGTVVTTNTSYIFTVTGDRNLVANFSINSYNISATTNPANVGTITGTGSYNYGATCTLTATPNEGYTFTNWTENGSVVSTSAEFSFAVTGSRNLVANFSLNSYYIAVAANPSNGGTVTGSGTYNHGTTANLTATASENYVFSNWTENGNEVSTDANYSFTVTGVRSLVANFTSTLVSYTVIATANPTGGGTVSGMGTYEEGATCTLTATANTGYTFTNWTENGYIVSTNATCSFTVTNNRSLVANFTLNNYYIATLANPTVGGTVTGAGNYNYGNIATLTATANNGYSFLNWTENGNVVSTSSNYSFTVMGTRNLVANFRLNTYTVSAAANPSAGGTVNGMGTFNYGETASLTVTANEGYTFASWTENGTVVSTNANYSFEVTGDRSLVANFSPNIYTISVSASPTNGGSSIGGGTYAYGTTCTLTATANEEYSFINWTENGAEVSADAAYSFIVSTSRTLVANFSYVGIEGQLSGSFSVSANTQVCFSQGNLQYKASTDTWRFATNQYDFIGESNANISQNYDGWIDLFGWGTSGWDNGNTYFHPWDSNNDDPALYGPSGTYFSLTGEYANADWGVYNAIINGGNQTNQWWTLSYGQWQYLIINRNTSSGIRYAKAQVNGVNGLILLPDNWNASTFDLQNVNTSTSVYSSNVISLSIWTSVFESNGAVFLPATGARENGTSIVEAGSKGKYWLSSTFGNTANAGLFLFREDDFNIYQGYRSDGNAVRLVRTIPNHVSYSINVTVLPSEGGTVNGAGNYVQGNTCILLAIANEGYTFVNWTKNGTVVSTNPNYSFSVTENGTYVANFQLSSYQVTATANPTAGGTITGAGTYNHGQTCTLSATANSGYVFSSWMENGEAVSTNATYSFTVSGDRALTANFAESGNYWEPEIEEYEDNMTLTCIVQLDGVEQTTTMLELGAFCGTECRGSQRATYFAPTNRYIIQMTVFGENNDVISFRLYDHQQNQELLLTPPAPITFTANGYGSLFNPYVLNFTSTVLISAETNPAGAGTITGTGGYAIGTEVTLTVNANTGYQFTNWTLDGVVVSTSASYQFTVTDAAHYVANFRYVHTQALNNGWNWWSSYIELTNNNGLSQLENSIGSSGIVIKSRTNGYVEAYQYQGTTNWYGTLNSINNEQMYKIRTNAACNASIVGSLSVPANHPITIKNGWNWIGFPCNQNVSVDVALSGFTPENNDVLKGRNGFTTYYSDENYSMWYGTLNTLEPGKGYMYRSNSTTQKTLVFQTGRGETTMENVTTENIIFQPTDGDFADNMTITAVLELDGEELRSEDYELAAFVGDECRGSVRLMYVEPIDRYVAFLVVFGEPAEAMHFTVTDGTQTELSMEEIAFEADGMVGSLAEPKILCFGTTRVDENGLSKVLVYPNPSNGVFNIQGQGIRKIEVFNAFGQAVVSEETGNDHLQIDLSRYAEGCYMLRVVTDNGISNRQLIKK